MTQSADTAPETSALPQFPMRRTCPFSEPAEYAELRENEPVSRAQLKVNGKPTWLVTKHEHVRQVLGDARVSSNLKLPGYPHQFHIPEEMLAQVRLMLLSMDPPDHTAQRRMLIPEFTARRVREMRPRIQEIVDEHIDAMLASGGPVDLVTALALPVPSLVICELLGVPYEDHAQFEEWSAAMMNHELSPEEYGAAVQALDMYLDKLVTLKENEPGDDLISRFLEKNRTEQVADHVDVVTMARLMLVGGHETTANMIALGVLALLEHPDQLAELQADPSLLPHAIEELLRVFSISDSGTARVAVEDIEVGGVTIRAGEGILALNNAADHDESVFPDPGTLDIHRKEARSHLAFGYGIHQCIGANLARVELEVVYGTLLRRIPGLRLAAERDRLRFKDDAMVYGVYELPVTW
ncbi:cytochrome P450 [Streptomyces minutiscleroticus]|uniref:Cytochrome P450 n=1 Tax=Streptomyces minutiscleroticus TaxID=68238 RepID=A0A918NYI6_9ACTN|nr:cytochrome P450 [Streptomyces minutiscleroticus]GGY07149.1 cytochrome P450 [Streptomyces minutiscleroticus]